MADASFVRERREPDELDLLPLAGGLSKITVVNERIRSEASGAFLRSFRD